MPPTQHVARANVALLGQGIDLLARLTDRLYTDPLPPAFPRGTGPHIRHCLDHVALFLDGLADGRIDYDRRARATPDETDRRAAIARMKDLAARLADLGREDADRPLLVKADAGGEEAGDGDWSCSTVKRELQFLLSHTIHHYALIAARLRAAGFEPAADFGVAPSTLRFENRLPCAR